MNLEEVGHEYFMHHTMFRDARQLVFWRLFQKRSHILGMGNFLVDVLKLNPERLYATVFEGYEPDGFEP